MLRFTRLVATALMLCTGCVSNGAAEGSDDDPSDVRQTTGSLLPWKVGKVKETGGQTEVLVSYELMP